MCRHPNCKIQVEDLAFGDDGYANESGEGVSASDWINAATETEIADTLYKFGEERFPRRITRRIITARESKYISTTN